MEQEQENLNQPVTLKVLGEFTEEVLLPAIGEMMDNKLKNYPTKVELYEILKDYPTRSDMEEHKDEIIKVIRGKMESMVQHQTVVTDVIEYKGCARLEELEI